MTTYFEDIREGDIFRGDEVIVDNAEMLAYARRNDPQPFHVDEELAKHFPYGGLTASAGYTVTLWYRSSRPIIAASIGTSRCRTQCVPATACALRSKSAASDRRTSNPTAATSRPRSGFSTKTASQCQRNVVPPPDVIS